MKVSLPTHIVIDNLPPGPPWYQLWAPIIIAIIAIILSAYSIYLTRRAFVVNTRPYIWANNYVQRVNNAVVPQPSLMMLTCKDYPAKVRYTFSITLENMTLFTFTQTEEVQFPDGSQWFFGIDQNTYDDIMNRPSQDQARLHRIIEFDYSDLGAQRTYKSVLKQIFLPLDNQWRTVSSKAS